MTDTTNCQIPAVAFLGFCERANSIKQGPPLLWKHNILELKHTIHSTIYPISLTGGHFAISVYDASTFEGEICLRSNDGEKVVNFESKSDEAEVLQPPIEQLDIGIAVSTKSPPWTTDLIPTDEILIKSPGQFDVCLLKDNQEFIIGHLIFDLAPAEDLTPDRIAAIKSDPNSVKDVRITFSCNQCGDTFKSYTGFDRNKDQEDNGLIWYKDLPDRFECNCGKNDLDLTILRQNMHGLLGQRANSQGTISSTRLYEKNALEVIVNDFMNLLNLDPLEEPVQKFIEENPLLLYQFSPQRIFYKPPILSKYYADIAVVNQKKELILIELERPGKSILKKDGGRTADLQRPFTQVEDWLFSIEQHRNAVLDGFDLSPSDVSKIRGVVVMGRDNECNEEHLRKLKWNDHGKIDFYTYDDLVNGLITLIRNMRDL